MTDTPACAGHPDPDMWFRDNPNDKHVAKMICRSCPISDSCLKEALDDRLYGIWGGTDDDQRRQLLRHKNRPVLPIDHGTVRGYWQHIHRYQRTPICDQCRAAYNLHRKRPSLQGATA